MKILDSQLIHKALQELDSISPRPFRLIVGGGGALVGAYRFPLATEDIDALALDIEPSELNPLIEIIRKKLSLSADWLNPYFSSFMHVLPSDYHQRLKTFFQGKHVTALALGPEDLLIMKCFAGRDKDIPHARALLREKQINTKFVEDHLFLLNDQKLRGAQKAIEFLEGVVEL